MRGEGLSEIEAKDLVLITRGYTIDWHRPRRRVHSLDRMCQEQREMQIWFKNPNSKVRKRSLVESFNYWLEKGCDRATAYEKACWTQVHSRKAIGKELKIDARTYWVKGK